LISADALPQIPLGELTALPRPLAVFKGPTSKGTEGKGRGREGVGKESDGQGEGRERERREGREGNEGVHLTHFAFRTLAALEIYS